VTTFLIAGPIVDKASERKAILNPGSQRVNHDKIGEYHTFSRPSFFCEETFYWQEALLQWASGY
jgi:hypothetical protein